jgi:membrane protein DedA with SNARE-associated domain
MLGSVLALLAGAMLAASDNVDVNVSLVIILASTAMFVADYVRSQRQVV